MSRPSKRLPYRTWSRGRAYRLPHACYEPGFPIHVSLATLERARVFTDRAAARTAAELLAEHAHTVAACVMPDHVHWILDDTRGFSDHVRAFKTLCVRRLRERGIALRWQRSFWDHVVRTREGLAATVLYVLQNPVRHELVRRAADWPYSVDRTGVVEVANGIGDGGRWEFR